MRHFHHKITFILVHAAAKRFNVFVSFQSVERSQSLQVNIERNVIRPNPEDNAI
jgi:hypothetical protein